MAEGRALLRDNEGSLLCDGQQTGCKGISAQRSWTKGEDNQLENLLGSIVGWLPSPPTIPTHPLPTKVSLTSSFL